MARPRIFISSTYYDLRILRADLERFIRELGYEPVLFERGHVPYGKEEALEEYCYREIASCDIVVVIIGGKFGSESKDGGQSITHKELKAAIDQGKQIHVFVEKSVLAEYRTWLGNKLVKDFKPVAANDARVHKFIEEIFALPSGNPIEGFELSDDIVRYLKEQWAGLFQRLLNEESRQNELNLIEGLNATASTLNNLVTFLTEERSKGDAAIKDILLSSHPAFDAVKKATKIPYRVVFHSFKELSALLEARTYVRDEKNFKKGYYEWDNTKSKKGIRIWIELFNKDGGLKVIKPEDWRKEFVEEYDYDPDPKSESLPF